MNRVNQEDRQQTLSLPNLDEHSQASEKYQTRTYSQQNYKKSKLSWRQRNRQQKNQKLLYELEKQCIKVSGVNYHPHKWTQLEQQIADLQDYIAQKKAEEIRFELRLRMIEQIDDKKYDLLKQLKKKLIDKEKKKCSLSRELKDFERQVQPIKATIEEKTKFINELSQHKTTSDEELKDLKVKLNQIRSQSAYINMKIDRLRRQIKTEENQIERLKRNIELHQKIVSQSNQIYKRTFSELKMMNLEITQLNDILREKKAQQKQSQYFTKKSQTGSKKQTDTKAYQINQAPSKQ